MAEAAESPRRDFYQINKMDENERSKNNANAINAISIGTAHSSPPRLACWLLALLLLHRHRDGRARSQQTESADAN
jgi:hypothetical protein